MNLFALFFFLLFNLADAYLLLLLMGCNMYVYVCV